MRKKLTRPQIEEIVRAKLKNKLSEQNTQPVPMPMPAPIQSPGPPPEPAGRPPMPEVGGSPGLKAVPPVNQYGGKDDANDIYKYFDVPPPMPPVPPEYVGEEGQAMTPPGVSGLKTPPLDPGNRDIPVMPPLREEENMDEGVGMYLMNKAGAVSDSDYKNYNKYQNMKKQDKKNLGTSADDIKQGTGRARQFSQIDSGGTTESQLREFVRSKLTQILKTPNQKKVSESIFAPNHYCVHHGGVYLDGKMHMGEAINHNYDKKLGKVTHYKMRLDDGRILENVPAEVIQVTNASLAEYGGMSHGHRDDEADKDYDGDGKVETGSEEYMGSKDKAIKKAVKSEGSGDRNDKDREQGHGKQRQKAGSDGKKGDLEEVSNKEWYDSQLFEALSRKWSK